MAYWDGGSGTSDGRRIPPTVRVRLIPSNSQRSTFETEECDVDKTEECVVDKTEECVIDEAEDVVTNFIYETYNHEVELGEDSNIPSVPELFSNSRPDCRRQLQTIKVAQTLAKIGEVINRKDRDTFQDLVDKRDLTENTVYEEFADIAERLFEDEINWGRISALMYLAYCITINVVKKKTERIPENLKLIISYVVRFIKEKLAGWIAKQGGWTAAFQPSLSTKFTIAFIVVGGGLAIIAAVYYLSKRS